MNNCKVNLSSKKKEGERESIFQKVTEHRVAGIYIAKDKIRAKAGH